MKRIPLAAYFAVTLSGCVSQGLNKELQGLVGQDIHAAVARLGYSRRNRFSTK